MDANDKKPAPLPGALSVAEAPWFRQPETQIVFACLNREGFEARAVGGAVRNSLLGRTVTEVDFAATSMPNDTMRLAALAGLRSVPTGIAHGTVTVLAGEVPFEVTTLRRDVETHGRHATVAFGKSWTEDACRRDFTLNALYADATGRVHDPLGGLNDLLEGRVRFIGDPIERIREDYLRILRFFRFSASYGKGSFDQAGIAAAISQRNGLFFLSGERIGAELLRLLTTARAPEAIEVMDETGLLVLMLGNVSRRRRFERVCLIEAALQREPDPLLRLGALAVFVEENAARLATKLRLSSKEAGELEQLAAALPLQPPAAGQLDLQRLIYRLGAKIFFRRLLLAWASAGAGPDDAAWRSAASLAEAWPRPEFPLRGANLTALGIAPGPRIGALLKELEERWIAGGFVEDRQALLNLARGMIQTNST
jgi:poly(A) polymerase